MNKQTIKRQLWKTTDERCKLTLYLGSNGPVYRSVSGVRVLFWPSLKPCWEANMYIVHRLRMGRSIGTVRNDAAQIALLLVFLYQQNLSFDDISNDVMNAFSDYLVNEEDRVVPQSKRRGGRQTNKILRRTLDYLQWYQALFPVRNVLVGPYGSGAQITVEEKSVKVNRRNTHYLRHECMVPNDIARDVKPMARNIFTSLLDACGEIAKSRFVQSRARIMLKLLSDTGARRVEIATILVEDVLRTKKNGSCKLLLKTAKRGDWKERLVPIPEATLDALLTFIEIDRRLHLRKLKHKQKEITDNTGPLLLTFRGKPLSTPTITVDISRLRKIAGISERATAHMLRHRWITIQVVERLKAYIGKKLPIDIENTILTKVASMTGHKQIESLKPYIYLAFDEMGVWDTSDAVINMRVNAEAAHREIQEIRQSHPDGESLKKNDLKRVDKLLEQLLEHIKPEFVEIANKRLYGEVSLDAYM
ncbi:tyrosine-type recombinase/integrase [Mariprofundus ferrooxydans]|nr:site-specific integrase [Mariprofundus ferrooxydans]